MDVFGQKVLEHEQLAGVRCHDILQLINRSDLRPDWHLLTMLFGCQKNAVAHCLRLLQQPRFDFLRQQLKTVFVSLDQVEDPVRDNVSLGNFVLLFGFLELSIFFLQDTEQFKDVVTLERPIFKRSVFHVVEHQTKHFVEVHLPTLTASVHAVQDEIDSFSADVRHHQQLLIHIETLPFVAVLQILSLNIHYPNLDVFWVCSQHLFQVFLGLSSKVTNNFKEHLVSHDGLFVDHTQFEHP